MKRDNPRRKSLADADEAADHDEMSRPVLRTAGWALPLAASVGLGTVIAFAVGDDIVAARQGGQVARGGSPVPYEYGPSAPIVDEHADAYGFSMAQQSGVRRDEDCGRMGPEFRRGCRLYLRSVTERPIAAANGDPIAQWSSELPTR